MTYTKLLKEFLEYLEIEKGLSDKTIRNYHHYLLRLSDFAGDIKIDSIDAELIRRWRLWLNRLASDKGDNLSKQTQNYHLIALRNLLKYCIKRGFQTLPPDKIELVKVSKKQVTFLTNEEIKRILETPDSNSISGLRDKAILELLFSSGLRVSELTNLNRENINLDKGEFTVRGKGQKDRPVFISQSAKHWLGMYLEKRKDSLSPLFINLSINTGPTDTSGNYKRMTPRSVQRIVAKYGLLAGITKKVSPHTMRHSFATDLLMNGADIRSVQTMLGHANISTTQIYTHITDPHLKTVHEKFHSNK